METAIVIRGTKLYVSVVTLSTQDYAKLPGFKRIIKQNKYQSKVTMQREKQYLYNLIDPSFQGVNSFLFNYLKIMHSKKNTQDIFFRKWK